MRRGLDWLSSYSSGAACAVFTASVNPKNNPRIKSRGFFIACSFRLSLGSGRFFVKFSGASLACKLGRHVLRKINARGGRWRCTRERRRQSMGVVSLKNGRAITMTWDRPPLNVFDLALLREMDQALTACAQEGEVDVVVFQGAGTRAFSAGVDVRDHSREKVPEMLKTVHGVIRKMLALPQVTIAAVRGLCLGGGCEIASSC